MVCSRDISRRSTIAAVAGVGILGGLAWQSWEAPPSDASTINPGGRLTITDAGTAPPAPALPTFFGTAVPVAPKNGAPARTLAGTGMIQPVMYDPKTAATYVGFYDQTGLATIAKRTAAGVWTTAGLSDASGPVLALPGKSDVHQSIAFAVDAAGNLHVCACMHNSDMRYWRTTRPGDLSSLTFRTALPGSAGKYKYLVAWGNEAVVTYPEFFTAQDGTLYLMFRNGQSGAGNTYLYRYNTSTTAWSNTVATGGPLFEAGGTTGFTDTPQNYCAYNTVPVFHPDRYGGAYHMVWVWRQDATAPSNSTVHYAWTRDFTNWYPVNTSHSAPASPLHMFSHDTKATLVDPTSKGGILNDQVQVGYDASDRVVVTYYKVNTLGETKMYAARPTGTVDSPSSTWCVSDITAQPNSDANVWGVPDPATYASSWSGTANLNSSVNIYNNMPIVLRADGTMSCRYSYLSTGGYQARRIVFANARVPGGSVRLSDTADLQQDLPAAVVARDSATSSYNLAVRTLTSDSFIVPATGSWPAGAAGRRAHWVLRWESGPYSAANQWGTNYPTAGTELRLYLVNEGDFLPPIAVMG